MQSYVCVTGLLVIEFAGISSVVQARKCNEYGFDKRISSDTSYSSLNTSDSCTAY